MSDAERYAAEPLQKLESPITKSCRRLKRRVRKQRALPFRAEHLREHSLAPATTAGDHQNLYLLRSKEQLRSPVSQVEFRRRLLVRSDEHGVSFASCTTQKLFLFEFLTTQRLNEVKPARREFLGKMKWGLFVEIDSHGSLISPSITLSASQRSRFSRGNAIHGPLPAAARG